MPVAAIAAPAIMAALGQVAGGMMGRSAAVSSANKLYSMPVGNWRTPNSSVQYGYTQIDPSIRRLRESLLSQYQGLGPQYQSLLTQAGANSPGFIQSVLDPYERARSAAYGDISTAIGNRSLGGTPWGNDMITNFLADTGRTGLGLKADAIERSLGLQAGLLSEYGRNVLAPQDALNQQKLEQELRALGFSGEQASRLLEQSRIAEAAHSGATAAESQTLSGVMNLFGGIMGGLGGGAPGMPKGGAPLSNRM